MHVIDFTSEGTAQAMHSDKFPWRFSGRSPSRERRISNLTRIPKRGGSTCRATSVPGKAYQRPKASIHTKVHARSRYVG